MAILETAVQAVKGAVSRITGGGKPQWNDELAKFVNDEYQRCLQERRPVELQWRLNMAFLDGNQYVDINTVSMTIEETPPLVWWQEREVFNQIQPIMNTRYSKLSRKRTVLKVRPGGQEHSDLGAAKLASKLLRAVYHDQGVRKKDATALLWSEMCGTVFFKEVWDPGRGPVRGIYEDGTEIREGDLDAAIVVPPAEIFPDSPFRDDIEACRSIIHARAYHIKDIEELWGVKVDPEETEVMRLERAKVGQGGLGYSGNYFRVTTAKLKDHALVKEYWERPSREHPEGRLIIVASNQTLYSGPLPYRVGPDGQFDFPFTRLVCIRKPGYFWGKSNIELLIPVQRRYNALRNRKAEYLTRLAFGQVLVEEGSIENMDDFEANAASPGYVIEYKKGFNAPRYMEFPPLPASFEKEEATLLNEFTILGGVSEIARISSAPPDVKSGIALSLLLEQDDTRLSSTAENYDMAVIERGKKWLRMYKQFVKGRRTTLYVGHDNVAEAFDWDASDLRSEDVVIEEGAGLAESPAQRRAMVLDLLDRGAFQDPQTGRLTSQGRAKLFELLDYGHWEFGPGDDEQLHADRAERENRLMAQGKAPTIFSFDDDLVHIQRHNRYRLTTDFEELLATPAGEQIMAIFDQHVEQHLANLQAKFPPQAPPQEPQASEAMGVA